jgi:ribosome-associated heat shock protein Hsp15
MDRHNEADAGDGEGTDDGPAGGSAALRVDRWLWYARFYKSRSLAAAAVGAGRVRIDGVRVKPSRTVRVGERLTVALNGRDVELEVRALPSRRGPAPEARACYQETAASQARGVQWQAQQRLAALAVPRPEGRPDKKQRRELMDLARRQGRD